MTDLSLGLTGFRRRMALLASSVVLLAACGGGTASTAPSSAPSEAPASQAPASEAPATAASSSATAPTAEEIIEAAGITDDNSFCGTEPIKLGIHDGFGANPWSQASMAAVRSEAAKCSNVEQVVLIGGGDLQKSISDVNALVTQGVDALVIIPDFGEVQLPSLQAATAAGVKVVPWAADPNGTDGVDYVTYVDWSSPEAGQLWAEWMVDALGGSGKVVMLGGPAGNPVTAGQLASIKTVFEANPGMELLTGYEEWPVTNWDPATAQQQMSALLAQFPQIDGVISDYGTDLAAAVRAFQAANRPLVPMATLEANDLACNFDANKAANPKYELATISSRNWLGRVATRKAIAAAQGIENDEPSTYSLPFFEDTLNDLPMQCDSSLSPDQYLSNKLTAEDLATYGGVE
jgi:ribose transport system substrate-binding protein